MDSVLFLGSLGPAVSALTEKLRAQGFWTGEPPERVDGPLEDAVKHFQQCHLGPDGKPLTVDGAVGEGTWWALANPSGAKQRSAITASVPGGIGPQRTRILQIALAEHDRGVMELPDGSNRGPEIDKYLPDWARTTEKGPSWCCYFYSWVVRQALGSYPLRVREGSCAQARLRAVQLNLWTPKTMRGLRPIPGDAFVFDHGGGLGHIGFVLRVSEDRTQINTVEGNAGNRVKVGLRDLEEPTLIGFINNEASEATTDFELGVSAVPQLAQVSTR